MMELAAQLAPGRVAVAAEQIRANRWLVVEPPQEVDLEAVPEGPDRVRVSLGGFAAATVRLADAWPAAPAPERWPVGPRVVAAVSASELYRDRWMFHGPRFQGVVEIGPMGRDGLHGVLEVRPTRSVLLDTAGQLIGYWNMAHADRDRLALPFRIDSIALFGPEPPVGSRVACHIRILEQTEVWVRADFELVHEGRTWARGTGWEDRRFESDETMWQALLFPENRAYAAARPAGYTIARETWRTAASRELIARRFLSEPERAIYSTLDVRSQRVWLLERIAVKDAVRHWLWARGFGELFPIEISVTGAPGGRCTIRGPFAEDLRAAVACRPPVAVACLAEGRDGAIALEALDAAGEEAARERAACRAAGGERAPDERRGELVRFADLWVETRRDGDHVVAWTLG
jgi:hypothetical protein